MKVSTGLAWLVGAIVVPLSVGLAQTVQDPPPPAGKQLQLVERLARPQAAPPEKARSAYLLVYFKEHVHSLHFAVSRDGYSFTDVNNGQPVLSGAVVAAQKGIRDPYLMRGPDGAFYLTMTDLHIYAREVGLRTTQWERPEAVYGWGNNRNLILMKSTDLIHWSHARVDVTQLSPAYRDAGIAWAPEAIYDPARRRIMVYFSTRIRNGLNYLVYAYADPAFRKLSAPEKLFPFPRAGKSTVDADITRVGGRYHLFFSTDDGKGNIRQAVSDHINRGYVYDPTKVDPEAVGTEAPMVWRRHGTDTYVLMYDVYAAKPNNMGFSETTDFRTFRDIGHFNAPDSPMSATNFTSPKHGSVMAITPAEADRLERYFAGG
ncbi:glycoside hydrolase family 43 protein [Sphingomonas sanguinis]|uniref:glycoside hydrolase family 43 protein n=1 Tax=Sphingomonas sanguinis TaxID=33051 RepID=UPI001C5A205C|nr:glycoside hydrolase family 43 protein [Sphingomonas sanguinis]QXT35732.1 glycoside hydrolase family 43 protein [Sphingomonas sanguinis]